MNRIPEPELMTDDEQAAAYARADFSEPHNRVITLFRETFGTGIFKGYVLDLGCGPGDIAFRFARAHPDCIVHGIDGAEAMLRYGRKLLNEAPDIKHRVELIHGLLPYASPPLAKYDIIISNSLLHHLTDPFVLWQTVKQYAVPGAPIFIVDLKRPESSQEARRLVETYSGNEPEILKKDFYNSLIAAFDVYEIKTQLMKISLEYLEVKEISDRHLLISGYFKS
jgi:2-polyprenyl-3-methyl-5-hydroxy-6-metoxy-1,4-benzoquinol methylase